VLSRRRLGPVAGRPGASTLHVLPLAVILTIAPARGAAVCPRSMPHRVFDCGRAGIGPASA